MGRRRKDENEKKIKFGISINRLLYQKMKSENIKPSRIIEKLLGEYYENKKMH